VTYEVFVTDKAGGTQVDYPPVLERLGVDATDWEKSVRVTSRRFARELDIMAMMFAEARQRGEQRPRPKRTLPSPRYWSATKQSPWPERCLFVRPMSNRAHRTRGGRKSALFAVSQPLLTGRIA